MVDYIVMFSGGLTSFEAARRAIEKHGRDRVRLWFADTNTEDDDLYRFNEDVERLLNHPIEVLSNGGRNIWDIFREEKIMGNSRIDPCSRKLKRSPLKNKLKEEYPNPKDAIVVLGMDGIEDCSRTERAAKGQLPYETWFPLLDEPIVMKSDIAKWLEERGVERPRLYRMGFTHNNCGGFCVKAGMGQFAHLYKERPEIYAYHEQQEQDFLRDYPDSHTIMRDRRGKTNANKQTIVSNPMSMADFRRRVEEGETFFYDAGWSCMCFDDTSDLEWL
tara:strand:+ start:13862 stop:14686 length:825 start_codon:yes stop_codon:yes gene_type:complete